MKKLAMLKFNDTIKTQLEENYLYKESYIKALSQYILDCETPITIALDGAWETGKTSMMHLIQKEIKNYDVKDEIEYIEFNLWEYAQFDLKDKLPIILLESFAAEIDEAQKLKNIIKRIAVAASKYASNIVLKDEDAINSVIQKSDINQLKELKSSFQEAINNRLNGKSKKLIIFLDDIDRLDPNKAIEVLESIKIFLDCKKCVFIIAADTNIIEQGANEKFKEKGKDFFDKIIQVKFKLPLRTNTFNNFIDELLNQVLAEIKEIDFKNKLNDYYKEIINITLTKNPRKVKNTFNSFVIIDYFADEEGLYKISNNNSLNHIIRLLLFFLLCLQLIDNSENLYEQINQAWIKLDYDSSEPNYQNIKLGMFLDNLKTLVSKNDLIEELIKILSEQKNPLLSSNKCNEILNSIFDVTNSTNNNHNLDANIDFQTYWKAKNKLILDELNKKSKGLIINNQEISFSQNEKGFIRLNFYPFNEKIKAVVIFEQKFHIENKLFNNAPLNIFMFSFVISHFQQNNDPMNYEKLPKEGKIYLSKLHDASKKYDCKGTTNREIYNPSSIKIDFGEIENIELNEYADTIISETKKIINCFK